MKKKIFFTGGGSAGHVTPNLALIDKFAGEGWEVSYIGSEHGIEKELVSNIKTPYYSISTGKLRRYFSWKNFVDPFKILYGIIQSFLICLKQKPDVVFSKGGFVSFPVVVSAKLLNIPVIIHESDFTFGLANKLSFPFADKICVTFPETLKHLKNSKKYIVSGIPIRKEFFSGNVNLGKEICGFESDKKIISIFGGSLGASEVNKVVRHLLPDVLENFNIVHVCGKGKIDKKYNYKNYRQFEYLHEGFPHVLAASDLVISRSGANSVYELIALRKPHILLPLGKGASRGDQILNAKYSVNKGFGEMILQEDLKADCLLEMINKVVRNSDEMISSMEEFQIFPAVKIIFDIADGLVS